MRLLPRLRRSRTRRPVIRARAVVPRLEPLEDRLVLTTAVNLTEGLGIHVQDNQGNIYVTDAVVGDQWRDLDPGPGVVVNPDTFIAKYSPAGALLWVKDTPPCILTDSYTDPATGNVFLYGRDAVTRQLLKFDQDGNRLWSAGPAITGVTSYAIEGTAVDDAGALYAIGLFGGRTVDFDPGTARPDDTLTAPDQDVFLAKWDAAGNFQWVRQLGGAGTQSAGVVDGSVAVWGGQVYAVGSFWDTFAPANFTDQGAPTRSGSVANPDGFFAVYDAAGTFRSASQIVDAPVMEVAVDGAGVYLAGQFRQAADFDPSPAGQYVLTPKGPLLSTNQYNTDVWVARLSHAGTLDWAEQLGGANSDTVGRLVVHAGDVYLAGAFTGTTAVNPSPAAQYLLTAQGLSTLNGFVVKLTAAGAFTWGADVPTPIGASLTVSDAGVVVANTFRGGPLDFDPGPGTTPEMVAQSDADAYLLKLSTDGAYQWSHAYGSPGCVIDDGDAGYAEVGSGWKAYAGSGYQLDARTHAKGTGANKARWTFANLPPGVYQAAATWKAGTKNATNAIFKVNGAATPAVNQRLAPDDWGYGGTNWEGLGSHTLTTTGTLTVELSDQANGDVVADAVFVWSTGPAPGAGGAAARSAALPSAVAPPPASILQREASGTNLADAAPAGGPSSSGPAGGAQAAALPAQTKVSAPGPVPDAGPAADRRAWEAAADQVIAAIGSLDSAFHPALSAIQ